jgi:SHS2 domain-containing protein
LRRFEELEHMADLALRVYGEDPADLFETAAYAMFSQLADLSLSGPVQERQVEVEGTDWESLLVNWLNELLYLHETSGVVYVDFEVLELSPQRLEARVEGAPAIRVRGIIKAATYYDLSIVQTDEGYAATVVFDV